MVRPWNLLCSPNRAVTWMDRGSSATDPRLGVTLKRLDAPPEEFRRTMVRLLDCAIAIAGEGPDG